MSKMTYYGHSCFLFELAGKRILIDPFIKGNPLAEDIDIESINPDLIFLTHGHGDHVMDVETIATEDTPVIAPYEVANWFENKGLNAQGMNQGGIWKEDFVEVKFVPAIHSSSLPDGSYGGNPCGLIFTTEHHTFYVAGDTCLTMDMKLIPLQHGKIDFCILPVGGHFTMGVDEAIHAAKFVECNRVIGCHFDTFPPIEIDHQSAVEAFEAEGIFLKLPHVGEVIEWSSH